tara:strand:- start:176 stop:1045 length:870 start_codon:yes stop_codon:yes gene_type:complete
MKIPKKYIHQSGQSRGKVNQSLLQTGKPKGTFLAGDKHPTAKNFFYKAWSNCTNRENWSHRSSKFYTDHVKPHLNRTKKRSPQILKKLRTDGKIKFSVGDQHPKLKNYYFCGYDRGKERWETKEHREIRLQKMKNWSKARWPKIKDDPVYKAKRAIIIKRYSQKPENKKRRNKVLKVWLSKPHNAIAHSLRCRLHTALKAYKISKCNSATKLLGISIPKFMEYFESKFTNGMSWDNYGKWHIDHIVPCASFDLTKESEQKKCFHYTNLQPLWAHDNLSKHSKLNWRKTA